MKKKWNKEPQNSLDRECVEYFCRKPVFDRLLCGFREKYASYGKFAGTVVLRSLTGEDIELLEGFFQKNFHGQKSVSVSAVQFQKALKNSKFGEMEPQELLELYFQEEMTGKRERRQEEERRWNQAFEKTLGNCAGTPAEQWLKELKATIEGTEKEQKEPVQEGQTKPVQEGQTKPVQEGQTKPVQKGVKTNMGSYFMKRFRESGKNMEEMQRLLHLASQIINRFPYRQGNREYLAVFSAMLTGNPHAFDDGTREGQLLHLMVQWDVKNRGLEIERSEIFPAIQKQRLYLAAGILRDDISNYTMISGVRAWKKNGEIHEGAEGFFREGDMMQVSLSVIAGWERVECPGQTIYIVENPSVYAMLCRKWKGKRAHMCMNGQPRLSSVLMLDLLKEAGVKVYYAGDFDPEGLLIAQKIRQYYGGSFEYWHMNRSVYEKSRSKEEISKKRMQMLERITDEELVETAEAVKKSGVAGYQENVWKIFVKTS